MKITGVVYVLASRDNGDGSHHLPTYMLEAYTSWTQADTVRKSYMFPEAFTVVGLEVLEAI